jgi:outer membrane protein assembly factor BamB
MLTTKRISQKNQLCLTVLSLALLGGLCFAQPAVTLSTKTGPPTTKVLVSGTGFPASAAVEIYFDVTEFALTATNATGSFSKIEIQVPASTLPGVNWITAVVDVTGEAAQAPFNVRTNWSQLGFGPARTGENPYENVLSPATAGNLGLLWNHTTGGPVLGSPAVANGLVYIGSDDNNVYALNANTGAKRWQFTTGGPVESSPAVANDVVYVGSNDSNLYALNASTGALLWQFNAGGVVATAPAVVNGVVYVTSGNRFLYALNASTGAELWFLFPPVYSVSSSPTVANGVLYVTSTDANIFAFSTGTSPVPLWEVSSGRTQYGVGTLAVANGVVYSAPDTLDVYAVTASTGATLWAVTPSGGAESSPAVANGMVYTTSNPFVGILSALNARTGGLEWTFPAGSTGPGFACSPTVANGVVYVADVDGNIFALNASNGAQLWQFTTANSSVQSSPAIANGVVYFGSDDGTVYAFSTSNTPSAGSARPDPSTLRPNTKLKKLTIVPVS